MEAFRRREGSGSIRLAGGWIKASCHSSLHLHPWAQRSCCFSFLRTPAVPYQLRSSALLGRAPPPPHTHAFLPLSTGPQSARTALPPVAFNQPKLPAACCGCCCGCCCYTLTTKQTAEHRNRLPLQDDSTVSLILQANGYPNGPSSWRRLVTHHGTPSGRVTTAPSGTRGICFSALFAGVRDRQGVGEW